MLCTTVSLSAQLDSLLLELKKSKADTNKVKLLNDIAWEQMFETPDLAREKLQASITLSKRLDFKKGEAQAYNNFGVTETIHSNHKEALVYHEKALAIRQTIGDKKGVASCYNNIGNVYEELDDYKASIQNLKESLRIREELKDTARIGRVLYNIGSLYQSQGFYEEASDHIFQSLVITEKAKDTVAVANAYNELGNIRYELERWEEAVSYYEKAKVLFEQTDDKWGLASVYTSLALVKDEIGNTCKEGECTTAQKIELFEEAKRLQNIALTLRTELEDEEGISACYNNLGEIHKHLERLEEALQFFEKSLVIRKKLEDKKGIMEVYNGIGDVYRRQNKSKEALNYTEKYMAIAQEIDDKKFIQKAYKDFSKVYKELGKTEKALDYRIKYDELRYERLDESRVKDLESKEAWYGDIKKQNEIERQKADLILQDEKLKNAALLRNSLIGGALGLLLLAFLLYNRYRIKNAANKKLETQNKIIEEERKRSEKLLLNILPSETAEELKTNGSAKAKSYESVTVLFTDFKSFTQIAEQLSPEELVAELDECFRAFDDITSRFGIEKIKTIGDAYMCAGGLPSRNTTHPVDVVEAALEIQRFMQERKERFLKLGKQTFDTRIGIHTGPVVAGIVGNRKFAYDIWGDTVNTAARMEASGAIEKVNISSTTYELIKDQFECAYRGKIEAKNKGAIDMYFVERKI